MNSSVLVFASDLVDEGIDAALDSIENVAGVRGVTLASVYHDARDVFPHNPRRVVYFHEPGAVFFAPTQGLYAGLEIQPVRSRLANRRDVLGELVAACRDRELEANAWVVLFHCDRGRETEDSAPVNVFGDRYTTHLCPASPSARSYATALVRDVAQRGVATILAEAFHFHPFEHGYHHERAFVRIDETTSFLLSLCFCEHCSSAAARAGVDVARLRHTVADAIRAVLAEETCPPAPASSPELEETVRAMCDGDMGAFLEARAASVTSLVALLRDAVDAERTGARLLPVDPSGAVKGYASGLPTGEAAPAISWKLGVDVTAVAAAAGGLEVMAYAKDPDRVRTDLEAYAASLPSDATLGAILRPVALDCDSAENLAAKAVAAASAGAARVDYYHYGLVPLSRLGWIRTAGTAVEARKAARS